uniref:2'-phosphotransferase n=1 Tax=Phallusia mammillata TaxID=59560 RepID=A0A6F9D6K0_9ASCI|nr:protein argonaute-2 [Phallusia mammillata]
MSVPGHTIQSKNLTKNQKKNAKKRESKRKRNEQTALKDLQESDDKVVKEQLKTSVNDAVDKNDSVESKATTITTADENNGDQLTASFSHEQQGLEDDVIPTRSTNGNNEKSVLHEEEGLKHEQLDRVETALNGVSVVQAQADIVGASFNKETVGAETNVEEGNFSNENNDETYKRQRQERSNNHQANEFRSPWSHSQGHHQSSYQSRQHHGQERKWHHHQQQNYQTTQYQQDQFHQQKQFDRYRDEPPAWNEYELSKELVRIVRHKSYRFIKLDSGGYASVDQILQDKKFCDKFPHVTFDWIKHIVDSNDKKRFELKKDGEEWKIKATQGHTVKVENLALDPVTDASKYPKVVHGTSLEAWQTIQKQGLKRMTRTHIHFAIGMPGDEDVLSGMRNSSDVVIVLNLDKALKAGLKFFISSNKVILSEGDKKGRIHPKFFGIVMKYYPRGKLDFKVPPDYDDKEDEKEKREKGGYGRDQRGFEQHDQHSRGSQRQDRPSTSEGSRGNRSYEKSRKSGQPLYKSRDK